MFGCVPGLFRLHPVYIYEAAVYEEIILLYLLIKWLLVDIRVFSEEQLEVYIHPEGYSALRGFHNGRS